MVNKSPKCSTWMQSQKRQNDLYSFPRQTIHYHGNPSVCPNCGSDHELLIAKFRLKLKKVEKSIRPFRYDLNQIPCDYTVEVTNRFKELDLINRVPEELWMEVHDIL